MISITESARRKMIDVLQDERASFLRFGLQGGGCNGFQYYFVIEQEKHEEDFEIEIDKIYTLLIDSMSMIYLNEAEIDYKKDLMGESFVFNNPNVSNKCGCNQSVSFD